MVDAATLQERHEAIVVLFDENRKAVDELQDSVAEEVLPDLDLVQGDTPDELLDFFNDKVSLFRFLRRARFQQASALRALHSHAVFRLSTLHPLLLNPASSDTYLSSPLFFFHPNLRDKLGRPAGVLNLKHVRRTEDGALDDLKAFVIRGWEVGRRVLEQLSRESEGQEKVQMVLLVDLEGAGMSNLEVELLPFFLDLLRSHYPGMVGAIYLLNYGWMYAGMWALAKRVLPSTALERILFPSKEELGMYFDKQGLLKEHGGTVEYEWDGKENVLWKKYGSFSGAGGEHSLLEDGSSEKFHSATPSPWTSRLPTPTLATVALPDVVAPFDPPPPPPPHAAAPSLSRKSSRLSMTPSLRPTHSRTHSAGGGAAANINPVAGASSRRNSTGASFSGSSTPGGYLSEGLRRVPSMKELGERLEWTARAIASDSDSSSGEEEEEASDEYGPGPDDEVLAEEDEEGEGNDTLTLALGRQSKEKETSASYDSSAAVSIDGTSRDISRTTSRDVSRATSREGSPHRRSGGGGVSKRRSQAQLISPYHTTNPYYGYPAILPSSSSSHAPAHYHHQPYYHPQGPLGSYRTPRPLSHRRRKRDLVRTLTYLAALRFLALHRYLERRLGVGMGWLMRLVTLGVVVKKQQQQGQPVARPKREEEEVQGHHQHQQHQQQKEEHGRRGSNHVRWQDPDPKSAMAVVDTREMGKKGGVGESGPFVQVDMTVFYVLVFLLLVRSPVVGWLLWRGPKATLGVAIKRGGGGGGAGVRVSQQQQGRRKRDVVRETLMSWVVGGKSV